MKRARDHAHTNRKYLDEYRRTATTLGETWGNHVAKFMVDRDAVCFLGLTFLIRLG
jgi:hypothetical protein